ncbi:hypothetical protein FRC02_010073 [Tulasnella sp. 418]|nr:hypothetical protein FRC02_010073 [Tulasnella sp. 418]
MVSHTMTPLAAVAILAYVGAVSATSVPVWGQCGGLLYHGSKTCVSGAECKKWSIVYSQCVPTKPATTKPASTTKSSTSAPTSTPTGLRKLHKLASKKGRYFGSATDAIWDNDDAAYKAITGDVKEFGLLTPTNAMKWAYSEPNLNEFYYKDSDFTVAWAHNNKQVVRGHTFVWHSQLAPWVEAGNFTAPQLTEIIKTRIENLGGHFKGQLYAWDVVNEAFNEDGTYRETVFYNTLGKDYIPLALKAARKADPKAKLYLNDYNIDGVGAKSDAYYKLAKDLLRAKVPLDGIGLQGHLITGTLPTTIAENIKRFADLGLEVAITELDIRHELPSTPEKLAQQAKDYAAVVKACVSNKKCVGVQTWDTSDDVSWIPGVFPAEGDALLFDANKKPKPAYYAVAEALEAATISGPGGPWV